MNRNLRDEIKQNRPFASLEQEAYLSLGRTWARLDHELAEALKAHAVTPTQYNVLRILRGAGENGLCRGEIMERMITRVPDATRLLDRMEAAGLIARARGEADRRFVTTRITEEGRRVVEAAESAVMRVHQSQFQVLDAKQVKELVALLGLLRASE